MDARDISLLFAVDWMLYEFLLETFVGFFLLNFNFSLCSDRCRTTSNVIGDCFAAAVIEKFSKKDLMKMDAAAMQSKSEEIEMLIQSV